MLKLRHTTMIILSGLIWMGIGTMLLSIGLKLLITSAQFESTLSGESFPILQAIAPFMDDLEQAALAVVVMSLFVGFFKGRFVLSKSAFRSISHIRSLAEPAHLSSLYSKKYYILLAVMVCLGMSIKYLGIPSDVRGAIDVAVGAALLQGAMVFFRQAKLKAV